MSDIKITPAFVVDRPKKYQPEDITSHVIIHFRPASDWLGKGYGFDWMREVDYDLVSPNAKGDAEKYEETVSKHYREPLALTDKPEDEKTDAEKETDARKIAYDANNPYRTEIDSKPYLLQENVNAYQGTFVKNIERFKELERVYNYHQIIHPSSSRFETKGLDTYFVFPPYYCSWMSIYPDPEKQVKLSLIADVRDDLDDKYPDSYELEYNEEFFDITLDKGADLKQLTKGEKKGIPDAITFTCKKEFSEDQIISIYSIKGERRRLSGRMYVWSNEQAKQKKANIISVIVKTKISVLAQGIPTTPIISPIEGNKKLNAEYLRQALIELKDENIIELDLQEDKNFQPTDADGNGGHYSGNGGIVGYYETEFLDYSQELSRWLRKDEPDGFIELTVYLYKKLQDQLKETGLDENMYQNYTRVYYLDQSISGKIPGGFQPLGGYSDAPNKAIVLRSGAEANTVAHEILHALNIMHSFNNREYQRATKFCFKAMSTDNIMDYSHMKSPSWERIPMDCLWKHQWEVANKSVMADGSIRTTQQLKDEHIIIPQ